MPEETTWEELLASQATHSVTEVLRCLCQLCLVPSRSHRHSHASQTSLWFFRKSDTKKVQPLEARPGDVTGIFCFRIICSHYYWCINLLLCFEFGEGRLLFYFFPLYAVKLCKNLKPDAFHSINEYLLDLKYMGYFDGYLE